MNSKLYFTAIFIFMLADICAQQTVGVVKATLNGLQFVFDKQSGSLLGMSHPATGVMLQTTTDSAGIVDLAFPVKEFEPLRLASRYSKNAQIVKTQSKVTIHWEELGASRSFAPFEGKISATVIFEEEGDGKSISISCKIENYSEHTVPQVVFPDFFGIVPFAGIDGTEFRTGGTVIKPFVDLVTNDHDYFYALDASQRWFHYGDVFDRSNLIIKWMDIGSLQGGLSIFSKNWGTNLGYNEGVFLKLYDISHKLRYMNTQNTQIAPNSSWQSALFILTPHENGWAKGIEPYRLWAKQNIKPLYPLPNHVRDGLGYRSIWVVNFYPDDPQGTNFKFSDFPKVAKEAKENGLDELVFWNWNEAGQIPMPPPFKIVGTEQEMINAVAECKKIGVNAAPFRSVMLTRTKTSKKYGQDPNSQNYTFHPDFVPLLNPPYAFGGKGAMIPSSNKSWQEDVLASCKHLIDIGIPSIAWDQFFTVGPGHYLDTLVIQIRKLAKEKDPQSTFGGEAGTNMENECDYLDYTWNWFHDSCDYRPLISALSGPRININIDKSVPEVKYGFADNLYLNLWTRKPGGINGSGSISNYPELSKALKQCARLRKQFINYFVNGTFIADCLLSKKCSDAKVSTYILAKSMLVIVINKSNKKEITFHSNIEPWLKSATGRYKIRQYNDGTLVKTTGISKSQWSQKTVMKNLDICIYEVIPE